MGLAETAVLGAFLAQDLILFVLFFDLMLVPFYFLVGQWGGPDRVAATFKLVVYTLVGSLLMLAAAVATGVLAADGGDGVTFSIQALANADLGESTQRWIFVAFALAFLIKMPAFPFHGWMPDGYRNMPLPALAVFSAVLSKVAAYGFLRVVLPVFPDADAGLPDGDAAARARVDPLRLGAWRSRSHEPAADPRLLVGRAARLHHARDLRAGRGRRRAGRAAADGQPRARRGAAVLHRRCCCTSAPASEDIREMGGVAFRAPVLATLFLIVALATLAMPGSANFAGEFLILLGVFNAKLVIALIAFDGRRDGVGLHAARVHPHDAQPASGRASSRSTSSVRDAARARAARARDPRVRALSAAGAGATPSRRSSRSSAAPADAVAQQGATP